MEPVNITICGTPSPQTLTDLFAIALRDGLGFILPPRLVLEADPAVRVPRALKAAPRALPAPRTEPDREPVHQAPPARVSAQAGVTVAEKNEAAARRRAAILGQLRRVGDKGLSFKALLDAMRPHLASAGDQDQQVAALRNGLTTLGRDEKVRRVAGQWIACD